MTNIPNMELIKNMSNMFAIFGINPDYIRMTNVPNIPNMANMLDIFLISSIFGIFVMIT